MFSITSPHMIRNIVRCWRDCIESGAVDGFVPAPLAASYLPLLTAAGAAAAAISHNANVTSYGRRRFSFASAKKKQQKAIRP